MQGAQLCLRSSSALRQCHMFLAAVGSAMGAFQLGKARLDQSLEIFPMQNAVSVKTRIFEGKYSLVNTCIFSFTMGKKQTI